MTDPPSPKTPEDEFYEAHFEVSKGTITRARAGAEFVEKAAAAIATIYTGVLAVAFSVADNPLPLRGMIPAVFLALSIAGAAFYLGFPSGRGKVQAPAGSARADWANAYTDWTKRLVLHRAWAIRGAIVALAVGALFLPAPFIQVKPIPTTPPAEIPWPEADSGSALEKIVFTQQVKETARLREKATPIPTGRKLDESRIWWAAAVGLLLIFAVVLLSWIGSLYRTICDMRASGTPIRVGPMSRSFTR